MGSRRTRNDRVGDRATAVAGLAAFVLGGALARRGRVSELERRCFRAVNNLPAGIHAPVWAVMQLGSLGGALGVAAVAAGVGRPALARQLAAAGGVTWVAAKAVKSSVGRGRPTETLDVTRILGAPASGLGYPSGHAAVAASLAIVCGRHLTASGRRRAWSAALLVGPARMYVGAHLPLDVVGGIGLGVAVGALGRSAGPGATVT